MQRTHAHVHYARVNNRAYAYATGGLVLQYNLMKQMEADIDYQAHTHTRTHTPQTLRSFA